VLDPIKPAYNQRQPDGQLKLTASNFNRLQISMPAVLVTVPTDTRYAELGASFIKFFYYCLSASGFHGAGKDNRDRCTNNPSGCHPIRTIGAPTSITPHFYAECTFSHNPPNLSWLGTGPE